MHSFHCKFSLVDGYEGRSHPFFREKLLTTFYTPLERFQYFQFEFLWIGPILPLVNVFSSDVSSLLHQDIFGVH